MKILAVDDDLLILEFLSAVFGMFGGHTLLTADSGAQALEIAAANPDIQCFLLDVQMPNMDGITLCKHLRAMPSVGRAPILMITAMSEKRYIDKAFAAGATDYINKPFEISELRSRISLVDSLIGDAGITADKIFAVRALKPKTAGQSTTLLTPFPIHDIDGVIDEVALENYLGRLTRNQLFGSSVFSFAVRRVEELYAAMSPFDFEAMIIDVAEALSECMSDHQFLMAYMGDGIYGCVTEDGWTPDTERFVDTVQLVLHHMDLHCSDGRPLKVRVSAGVSQRLTWRSGNAAVSALVEACNSAKQVAEQKEKDLDEFWFLGKTA